MDKTIYSRQSECVSKALAVMRGKAKLTQRQLAEKLGRERSLIGRLELGERRIDLVEFYRVCRACGEDPAKAAGRLMRQIGSI
jgi:transcriptional regulator with XRE-family HTH domain